MWCASGCAGVPQGEEAGEGGAEAALRVALQEQEQLLLAERARVAALDSQVDVLLLRVRSSTACNIEHLESLPGKRSRGLRSAPKPFDCALSLSLRSSESVSKDERTHENAGT